MTRGDFFYKWFWYGLAVVPVWLLEDMIFSHVSLFGVTPVLLPLTAIAVAVLEGTAGGAGFGMAMGLLCYAIWPHANPIVIPGMVLTGIAIGSAARYGLKQNFVSFFLCSAVFLMLNDLVRMILGLLNQSAPLLAMIKVSLAESLVSLLVTPLIWLPLRKTFDRVGGTRLM